MGDNKQLALLLQTSLFDWTALHGMCLITCGQNVHGQEVCQDIYLPLVGCRWEVYKPEVCQDIYLPLIGCRWEVYEPEVCQDI